MRVVFDASREYYVVSMNNRLLSGPDNSSQIGVLCRFRDGTIAFACDIKLNVSSHSHLPRELLDSEISLTGGNLKTLCRS